MTATTSGSSPLTRGKQAVRGCVPQGYGLIPAHAGKTGDGRAESLVEWAHPRSRGENPTDNNHLIKLRGSSPLTRGKPHGQQPPNKT